jgi:hypothetical protein
MNTTAFTYRYSIADLIGDCGSVTVGPITITYDTDNHWVTVGKQIALFYTFAAGINISSLQLSEEGFSFCAGTFLAGGSATFSRVFGCFSYSKSTVYV